MLSSTAVNVPPVTVMAGFATRLSVAEVTFGVTVVGAVAPPAIEIGTETAAAPLLMATTTTVPSAPV